MRNRRKATRPRGRPPLEEGVPTKELVLCLAMPAFEAVCGIARVERVHPQAVIRAAVAYYVQVWRGPFVQPKGPRNSRSVTRAGRF
jgi:hypothetical protein